MRLKLILIIFVVVSFALMGRAAATTQAERADRLRSLADGVELLRIRMLRQLLPLGQALSMSCDPILSEIGGEMDDRGPLSAWERLSGREKWIRPPEEGVISRMMRDLGASGGAGQDAVLSQAQQELSRLADEARSASRGKSRLYTTLGVMLGLAASVMAA